jgi:hypothetical protein
MIVLTNLNSVLEGGTFGDISRYHLLHIRPLKQTSSETQVLQPVMMPPSMQLQVG